MEYNSASPLTPAEIVGEKYLFRIPLYQRLFAWKRKDVRQLMEDLFDHFSDSNPSKSDKYYIGMLTAVKQRGRLDLIDGQQRITVITLIAIAMKHKLQGVDDEMSKKWNDFLLEPYSNDTHNREPRVFYIGRSEDLNYIKARIDNNEEPRNIVNPTMSDGIDEVNIFLSEKFNNDIGLSDFSNFIFNKLAFFITLLPKNYSERPESLNEYFEAMNSSGKALEQHEILKTVLLSGQSDKNKRNFTRLWNTVSNFERPLIQQRDSRYEDQRIGVEKQIWLYNQYISRYYNSKGCFDDIVHELCDTYEELAGTSIDIIPIEKKESKGIVPTDKEDGIISFSQFLLLVLAINQKDESIARAKSTDLLKVFDKKLSDDSLVNFYHQLLLYRLLFDLYVVRRTYTPTGSIHTLISRDGNPDDKKLSANERVRMYEAMLDVSTEPHIWLLPFLIFLDELVRKSPQGESLSQDLILKKLQEIDANNGHGQCPSLSELDYDHRNRYWFWRTDYAIWEKMLLDGMDGFKDFGFTKNGIDREAILQYEFRENRSIEHLHPRDEKHNEHWEWDEINRFGNLAMISNSFNSTQLNWLVDSKLENIKPQVENRSLQSLKLYFMYLQAKNFGGWTQGEGGTMQEHEEKIYKLLQDSINSDEHGQSES